MAAIISTVLVLPFAILELRNQPVADFPIPLFVTLWLLPAASFLILTPLVRHIRAGNRVTADPLRLLLRIAAVMAFAFMWGAIVFDQMPCFMGVANCD